MRQCIQSKIPDTQYLLNKTELLLSWLSLSSISTFSFLPHHFQGPALNNSERGKLSHKYRQPPTYNIITFTSIQEYLKLKLLEPEAGSDKTLLYGVKDLKPLEESQKICTFLRNYLIFSFLSSIFSFQALAGVCSCKDNVSWLEKWGESMQKNKYRQAGVTELVECHSMHQQVASLTLVRTHTWVVEKYKYQGLTCTNYSIFLTFPVATVNCVFLKVGKNACRKISK